jgi:hypothetical protein
MNYKRKRARVCTRRQYSTRAGNQRFIAHHPAWMCWWPAWHDILFHSRPHRRATTALAHAIKQDAIDPNAALWPLHKKPHKYYW